MFDNDDKENEAILSSDLLPSWVNGEFFAANKYLALSWFFAVMIFTTIYIAFGRGPQAFPGMTEAKQYVVNFQNPVIVDEIFVQSGQVVKKGQILFQLRRPDLDILEKENLIEISTTLAELNIAYNKNISALNWSEKLTKKKKETLSSMELKFLAQFELSKSLVRQRERLNVKAPFEGYLGQIKYNVGETISPYTPLISVNRKNPSLVKSYIPENFELTNWAEEKIPLVRSISRNLEIEGKIVAVGTTLIELPQRFQKDPMNRLFGREITVSLPKVNRFYLGEKVFVRIGNL